MLLSYPIVVFYLFYVDMLICALLTRSLCRVSDNRVTVKALGSFVSMYIISDVWGCCPVE